MFIVQITTQIGHNNFAKTFFQINVPNLCENINIINHQLLSSINCKLIYKILSGIFKHNNNNDDFSCANIIKIKFSGAIKPRD